MKLISMTSFVLNFKGNTAISHKAFEFALKSKNYANFLNSQLSTDFINDYFDNFDLMSETQESWIFKINGKFPFIIRKSMRVEGLLIYSTDIQIKQSKLNLVGLNP